MLGAAFGRFKDKSKPQFSCKKGSTYTLNPDYFRFWLTTFERYTLHQGPKTLLIHTTFPRRILLISITSFPREEDRGENPKEHALSISYMRDDSLPKSESRAAKERNFSYFLCLFTMRSLASKHYARSPSNHTGRVTPVAWEEISPSPFQKLLYTSGVLATSEISCGDVDNKVV